MEKNYIKVESLLVGGLMLGFSTVVFCENIDYYTSSLINNVKSPHSEVGMSVPKISFNSNTENEISMMEDFDKNLLEKFVSSILTEVKSLDGEISQMVDKNFWDLI